MAPQSISTALPVVVGMTGAIAARRMPWIRLVISVAPVSSAPVEPADTAASPSPSRSIVNAAPMEVSFFRRNTVAGSSHISTVSVVGRRVTPCGSVAAPHRAAAARMAASSPVRTMSQPKRLWALSAPLTISSGALSPPMASMMIFTERAPPLSWYPEWPATAGSARHFCCACP